MHGNYWIIAEHCLGNFMPKPKPQQISPALTSNNKAGHWIGSKGRRAAYREAARLHGYLADKIKWGEATTNNYFPVGYTMTAPVSEQLWTAALRAQGYYTTDRCETKLAKERYGKKPPETGYPRVSTGTCLTAPKPNQKKTQHRFNDPKTSGGSWSPKRAPMIARVANSNRTNRNVLKKYKLPKLANAQKRNLPDPYHHHFILWL